MPLPPPQEPLLTMKISPESLRTIVHGQLSASQRLAASGTFSGNHLPTDFDSSSPTNPINVWFETGTTTTTRKNIIRHHDIVALLCFYDDRFEIISIPEPQMDLSTKTDYIIGLLGDVVQDGIPVAFDPITLLTDFYGLLPIDTPMNTTLGHLKSTGPHVRELTQDDDGNDVTFLQNVPLTIDENELTDLRVGCLPLSVPLPYGHGIATTYFNNEDALQALDTRLQDISPPLCHWFRSISIAIGLFKSHSLHVATFQIHDAYFQGLNPSLVLRPTVEAVCKPIPIGSTMAKQLMSAKNSTFITNFDNWCKDNPDIYNELTEIINVSTTTPAPAPTIVTPTYQSKADKNSDARFQQMAAQYQLLLGTKGLNANGEDIVIPHALRPALMSFLEDTSPKSQQTHLQREFKAFTDARGEVDKIICHDADFSPLIFGYRMAAALHSGQFSMYPTEEPLADRRRSIGIFIMLRRYQHGDEYLADLERENTIRDEHLLGETGTSNATKADTQFLPFGAQQTYLDLVTALANAHLFFSFLTDIDATDIGTEPQPFLLKAINQLYTYARSPKFKTWFEWWKRQDAYWLCHALISDVHNVIAEAVRLSFKHSVVSKVLANEDVDAAPIIDFEKVVSSTLAKWMIGVNTNSLGQFTSPPKTLPPTITSKKDKQQTKKENKRQKTDNPPSTPSGNQHQGSTTANGSPSAFGNFNRRGSDPTKGFIYVNPPLANIPNGPRVSGKTPCGNFIMRGRSCPNGANCPYDHISFQNLKPEDIPAYDAWIAENPALSWAGRGPPNSNGNTQQSQQQQQQQQQQPRGNNRRNNQENRG